MCSASRRAYMFADVSSVIAGYAGGCGGMEKGVPHVVVYNDVGLMRPMRLRVQSMSYRMLLKTIFAK